MRAFSSVGDDAPGTPFGDRSLSRAVYAEVLDAVRRGDLTPGERINESDVARRLGISRTPVREAISRLSQDGLLTYIPRRGAFLTRPTPEDVEEIDVARSLIEGVTARLASQRITPPDVARLEALVDGMAAAARAGDWLEAIQTNARFHEAVVNLSGNRLLARMWSSLDPLRWLHGPVVQPGEMAGEDDLVHRHRVLIEALTSGNPDLAERAFKEHIGAVTERARDIMETDTP